MGACTYLCPTCMFVVSRGQKRTLDLLELDLQIIVSCHVGAGMLAKAARALHPYIFKRLMCWRESSLSMCMQCLWSSEGARSPGARVSLLMWELNSGLLLIAEPYLQPHVLPFVRDRES